MFTLKKNELRINIEWNSYTRGGGGEVRVRARQLSHTWSEYTDNMID